MNEAEPIGAVAKLQSVLILRQGARLPEPPPTLWMACRYLIKASLFNLQGGNSHADDEDRPSQLPPLERIAMIDAPVGRTEKDGLIFHPLEDETLIFDRTSNTAMNLNAPAIVILRHCDGNRTVSDLAAVLCTELGVHAGEDAVWLALGDLQKAGLLKQCPAMPSGFPAIRRTLRRRLAIVGAAAAIGAIMAPTAAQAASCVQNHSGCTAKGLTCAIDKDCCSCNCNGSLKCT